MHNHILYLCGVAMVNAVKRLLARTLLTKAIQICDINKHSKSLNHGGINKDRKLRNSSIYVTRLIHLWRFVFK